VFRIKFLILGILVLSTISNFANGLLMPKNESYPKDFLRNTVTNVTVNINGLVAETIVYQEFLNEWIDSVDAVYSFPLPHYARATKFLYWYDNSIYKAVLKVREQAVNPGTGEGGIAAEVNKYIGRNGIKIFLKGVAPGEVQKVELHYISLLDYHKGKCEYDFPLNTEDFVSYPLDHLQFSFNVNSNSQIMKYDIPTHQDFKTFNSDQNELQIDLIKPKIYINMDLKFYYEVEHNSLNVDFYSVNNDTLEGHFAIFIKPQINADPDSVLPKRVFFLLSTSSNMFGYKLTQSITAISQSLEQLSVKDFFNILTYNNYVQAWQSVPVAATEDNIQIAKNYLSTITNSYGSQMQLGIEECLDQIEDDLFSNSILIFSDGYSPVNPKAIESQNVNTAGIFPIAIGDQIDYARLEMTAALNFGFVTYIDQEDNLSEQMHRVFEQISQPILKNVGMEFGQADVSQVIPKKSPSTYAGSQFFTTGRYKNSGESSLSIAGTNVNGTTAYNFRLEFSDETDANTFIESLWAKETIDEIEREIEIYGENAELKDSLIAVSLRYNIRCRYTAYIADYEDAITDVEVNKTEVLIPNSYIAGNYPNPFNPSTNIRFYISPDAVGKVKLIKIYNTIGQLVAVIDVSHLKQGWSEVVFNGKDIHGNSLSSGVYIVGLQIGNNLYNTVKISLIK